jgi:hypothetical protein
LFRIIGLLSLVFDDRALVQKLDPVGASTGSANFLSLFASSELQQRVDSDGVPRIIISYIRATDSLAIIKIFIFYAGRMVGTEAGEQRNNFAQPYQPLEREFRPAGEVRRFGQHLQRLD